MGFRSFLFGQDPGDVEITDPDLLQARRTRELLRQRYEQQLAGGQTAGEAAIMQQARTATEQLGEAARGRAAGARGFGRLAAQAGAERSAMVGRQRLLGQAATAAGAQRAQDVAQAESQMLRLDQMALEQKRIEDEERKRLAKPGALGILGSLAGAGIGGLVGGPQGAMQGAQFGGAAGGGIAQFGQRY